MKTYGALVVILAALVGACGSADASGPPEISYGRDICVECGMIVSEARFAAAYRLADGEEKIFDDLGGLLLHSRDAGDALDPATTWVHDFETEEWVAVEEAYFVPTLSVSSPMGHSIVSFSDEARANAFAADVDGEVISWSVVVDLPDAEGLVGHHHSGDMDMGDTGDGNHEGHDMDADATMSDA